LLGNIGHTILFGSYLKTHAAPDGNMETLTRKMQNGGVSALLVWNVNPVYTWYNREAFTEGIKKVSLTVSLSGSPDETNKVVQYICPDNHYLESWNDAEPKRNFYSLMQPAISPIFDTRQMADTLLKWSGSEMKFYDFITSYWADNLMSLQSEFPDPVNFFDRTSKRDL
jgi:anaerobic selenocysteine-containing dehydrogenase